MKLSLTPGHLHLFPLPGMLFPTSLIFLPTYFLLIGEIITDSFLK